MLRETEVVVVGAGPTGLTLATLLRRSGVDCIVIDKATGPSTTSKAIGLQYRVSEILAWMGLVDRFVSRAAEQTKVNMFVDGALVTRLVLGALEPAMPGAFAPRPIIVPQSATEALLGDALRDSGGEVEWATELVDVSEQASHVDAVLANGARISARYVVSCEGAHSVARKRCGIAFEGKTYPYDFVMADVAMDTNLRSGEAYTYLHPHGVLSAITMPGERRWRLFIEAGAADVGDVTLDVVRALYRDRTGDEASAISDPTWLTRFKIHSRTVERFRSGRVFLAGDAAHLHSPSGGQGITTGMQDATNLAWKLAFVLRQGAEPSLLDTYDEERRPAARAVLAATDRNTKLLFAEGRFAKWFRNRVFLPLLDSAFVQRRLVGKLSQLAVAHRAGSLARVVNPFRLRGLRAGDRAPDVTVAGDRPTLFGLLGKGRLVALLANDGPELTAKLERLGIVAAVLSPDARAVFGRSSDVWLIRPDGYVVSRCALTDIGALALVLRRLLTPQAVDAVLGASRPSLVTARALGFVAICIQFLALVRTLGEVVRLRSTLTLDAAMPFIGAAMLTSVMAWLAVGLLFAGRPRATAVVAATTVAALVVIKAVAL